MLSPTVYAYTDPRTYLRDVLEHKRKQNPLFSLRAWAKQMGFRCHSSLVYLLNGTRAFRPEHVERINKGLRLQETEATYFRTLIEFTGSRTEAEKDFFQARLKLLEPEREQSLIESERFRLVADWFHMAILEMTHLKDFNPSPDWIARRLNFGVSEETVRQALERLLSLGLLRWAGPETNSGLEKTSARLTTPKGRGSESIREYHRQALANASVAIESQTVDERILNSCAFTVDSKRLPEAADLILKFRSDMMKLLESASGDETYQLNVQLFKLTRPPENK